MKGIDLLHRDGAPQSDPGFLSSYCHGRSVRGQGETSQGSGKISSQVIEAPPGKGQGIQDQGLKVSDSIGESGVALDHRSQKMCGVLELRTEHAGRKSVRQRPSTRCRTGRPRAQSL